MKNLDLYIAFFSQNYMEYKFNSETEKELDDIIESLQMWKKLFSITPEFFYDGWAIYLREKSAYPRKIVVSKINNLYSIKSFEIRWNNHNFKEEFFEIYNSNDIIEKEKLLKEIRVVIYGKDLMKQAARELKKI